MSEAANLLGVSECVIRTMVKHRMLPANQVTKGAPWLIEAEDLKRPAVQNYVNAHIAGQKAPHEHEFGVPRCLL